MPRLPRNQRTNVTIYGIAETLNISASTVSRALRGHPDIKPETVESVKATAKKLNYRPNTMAQSLRERRTRTLGVILPDIQSYFYGSVLNGIEEVAFRKGYQLMVCKSAETYERELLHTDALANQVDGLLACLSQQTRKIDHFKQCKQQGLPLVFFDRVPEKFAAHRVVFDNEQISFSLTEHLIRAGFKRIALLDGPRHLLLCQERMAGYRKALASYHLPAEPDLLLSSGFGYEDGLTGLRKLLKLATPPDAVLAGSDALAMAVLIETRRQGMIMPRDLGLVSFGSDPANALVETAITGLIPKGFEMGSTAAQLCIGQIESTTQPAKFRHEQLTNEITIRHSSVRLTNDEQLVSSYSRYSRQELDGDPMVYIY